MRGEPRAATIRATDTLQVLRLGAAQFEPMKALLTKTRLKRFRRKPVDEATQERHKSISDYAYSYKKAPLETVDEIPAPLLNQARSKSVQLGKHRSKTLFKPR